MFYKWVAKFIVISNPKKFYSIYEETEVFDKKAKHDEKKLH